MLTRLVFARGRTRSLRLLCAPLAVLLAGCSGSDEDPIDDELASLDAAVDTDSIHVGMDGGQVGLDRPDGEAHSDAPSAPPTITFLGASQVVVDCGATFVDPGAEGRDAAGNALDVELLDAEQVQTAAPGRFQIHYRALDAHGNSTELARDVFVCGPSCGDTGKAPINLSNWSIVQYEQNDQPDADWSVAADQLSVTQTVNADASILLSDFDATDYAVEGSWHIPASGDDDFVGFVFGYQDRGHFYLFDWKRGTQGYGSGVAEAGMTLKRVAASLGDAGAPSDAGLDALQLSIDDLWFTTGTGNVSVIADASGQPYRNTIPWQFDTDYSFFLEFHAGSFRIEVRAPAGDAGETVLASWSVRDTTYATGKFGFYNYSQGPVVYQTFTRRSTPGACSTVE